MKKDLTFFVRFFLIALSYVATGILGLKILAVAGHASLVWAPSGIALFALTRFGFSYWPVITLSAFIVNFSTNGLWHVSLAIAAGNTFEALAGAYLLRRFHFHQTLNRIRDVFVFFIAGSISSTLISASIGVASLYFGQLITHELVPTTFTAWWVGDVIGDLVIAPLLFVWAEAFKNFHPRKPKFSWVKTFKSSTFESAALLSIAALLAFMIFVPNHFQNLAIRIPKPYFIFPILVWAALRSTQCASTLVVLTVSIIATYGALQGGNVYLSETLLEQLFDLEVFMGVLALTGLTFSAVTMEQRTASEKSILADAALKRREEELERSNSDLEQFAVLASHDLKEPLRTISIWLGIIEKKCSHKLTDEEKDYFSFTVQAAKRMQMLIDALLSYSHIGRRQPEIKAVDCNIEFQKIASLMQAEIQELGAKIEISPLPTVHADPLLVGQVFQNILANALKYRGPRVPDIKVKARYAEGQFIFSVSDNGIGFPMQNSDRVFKLFQRLHDPDQYAGSGIGLALCKNIVERHGGKIWADSKEGEGSTFYFSLPS